MERETIEGRDSIKLTKTTKGYTWEIKLYREENQPHEDMIQKINKLDEKLRLQYWVKEVNE